MRNFYDVVVLGAGAAGIGAGRRLAKADVSFVLLEARDRIGGRALTLMRDAPLDLGCGWLHSGDRNLLVAIAEASGFSVDRTKAPWRKQSSAHGMTEQEQAEFGKSFRRFEQRIDDEAEKNEPQPASGYLAPGDRWNPLLSAVFSYISGAALDCIDARDYARYEDTGCDWRVREGYGALIAALGAELPVEFGVEATEVDHNGARLRVETSRGPVEAGAVIVAMPASCLVEFRFTPDLEQKREAAAALPLGAAEKLHFALAQAEEFPVDGHLFARIDSADTGSYHLRPMGRPMIEAYFGGDLARGLVEAGADAMVDFAKQELAGLLGSQFSGRLTTIAASSWASDPLAKGSYSYAKPGCADMRAVLAAPHENRIFFAGEACSRARFSTTHGAYETGHFAAEQALAALGAQPAPSPRA
jgi:monoamine oxidase